MHRLSTIVSLLAALGGLAACNKKEDKAQRAEAPIEARSGSTATGTGVFVETSEGVQATITVSGVGPGQHGLHLHEQGDCSAPDAESAGPHWNPDGAAHGAPGKPAHAGDFGNITVGADGNGRLDILLSRMTVRPGPHAVVGRALVLHEGPDDLMTQPSGNSGARIGCGVVAAK